jgi:hypothetical protein
MIRIFFFLFLILASGSKLFAQNFPLQGNEKWAYNQYQTAYIGPGGCTIDTWRFFELQGDTLLGGEKWFRLFEAFYVESYCTYPSTHNESFITPKPRGFLRDSADIWLYRVSGADTVSVLFSFKHEVGDQFFANQNCQVDEISETSSTPPRRIESQTVPSYNGLATKLIEGVGVLHSFFFPSCYTCYSSECQFAINLKCFKQNGIGIPVSSNMDCVRSDTIYQKILDQQNNTSTEETTALCGKKMVLLPNPAFDKVKIGFSGEAYPSESQVEIFDLTGRRCFAQNLFSSLEIDVTAWPPGIYMVRSLDLKSGQVTFGRLVKN